VVPWPDPPFREEPKETEQENKQQGKYLEQRENNNNTSTSSMGTEVGQVVASLRDLALRLKQTCSRDAGGGAAPIVVNHLALAKEGLGLLFDLGAALEHEKATRNLTGTTLRSSTLAALPNLICLICLAASEPVGRTVAGRRQGEEDDAAPPLPWQLGLQVCLRLQCKRTVCIWRWLSFPLG
jgi:hypothetical protein